MTRFGSIDLQRFHGHASICGPLPASSVVFSPGTCVYYPHKSISGKHPGIARGQRLQGFASTGPSNTTSGPQAVPLSELRELVNASLLGLSYSGDEADIIGDVLIWAQLRGNSQNVIKIPAGALTRDKDAVSPRIARDNGSLAVIDSGRSQGMLAMHAATELAIQRAQLHGSSIIAINNISSATGALGYWVEAIARQGLIGVAMSQSPEYVAPHGTTEPIFGTNPIAVGVPTAEDLLIMDLSTAAAAWWALADARDRGASVAEDIGFDSSGRVTSDPGRILDGGAIRVFDRSYKGSHLALMVEILAGALAGGAVQDKVHSANWGNLIMAIDPGKLGGSTQDFSAKVTALLQRVKGARKAPGVEEVVLPGERGYRFAGTCLAAGVVPLARPLYDSLCRAARRGAPNTVRQQSAREPVPDASRGAGESDAQQAQQQAMDSSGIKAHMPMPEASGGSLLSYEEQALLLQRVARLEARLQALGEQI